jgi:hypothetical protein
MTTLSGLDTALLKEARWERRASHGRTILVRYGVGPFASEKEFKFEVIRRICERHPTLTRRDAQAIVDNAFKRCWRSPSRSKELPRNRRVARVMLDAERQCALFLAEKRKQAGTPAIDNERREGHADDLARDLFDGLWRDAPQTAIDIAADSLERTSDTLEDMLEDTRRDLSRFEIRSKETDRSMTETAAIFDEIKRRLHELGNGE